MRAPARQRSLFIFIGALVFGLAWACGRNEIDNPVDPLPQTGTGGTGSPAGAGGGPFGGGVGGSFFGVGGSGPVGIHCGGSLCTPGAQICCAGTSGALMCVSAADPNACSTGVKVGCVSSGNCSSSDVCCLQLRAFTTLCEQPLQCATGGGVVICTHNSECAAPPNICCPVPIGTTGAYCIPPGMACQVPGGLP